MKTETEIKKQVLSQITIDAIKAVLKYKEPDVIKIELVINVLKKFHKAHELLIEEGFKI